MAVVVVQRYELNCAIVYSEGNMRLYIRREDQVDFQSTWFFVYIGINSDGSAWFLICTSLISQQLSFPDLGLTVVSAARVYA